MITGDGYPYPLNLQTKQTEGGCFFSFRRRKYRRFIDVGLIIHHFLIERHNRESA